MDEYKETIIDKKKLYSGGSHILKMWTCGTRSGFIVSNCINKNSHKFGKYEDAKIYFNSL